MHCPTCSKAGLVEIRMRVAERELTFRRCGRCEAQTWETAEGPIALSASSTSPASAERHVEHRRAPTPRGWTAGLGWHAGRMVATRGAVTGACRRDARRRVLARRRSRRHDAEARLAQWSDRVETWVGIAIVAACCIYVFVQLRPRLLLLDTTTAGGDTGAHVWFPAYLRDHLLPIAARGVVARLLRRASRPGSSTSRSPRC